MIQKGNLVIHLRIGQSKQPRTIRLARKVLSSTSTESARCSSSSTPSQLNEKKCGNWRN